MSEVSDASWVVSGGAAATGARTSGDSERMSDTVRDTTAESRRNAFILIGIELTSRCRTPTSPWYEVAYPRQATSACTNSTVTVSSALRVRW